jgi:raffinose/stachyose/melibiose transport system substrate-binding protein
MKEMADKGYLGETYMSNTWTNAIEAVGTGKYAMFFGYTSWQNEVARDYPQSGANNFKMFPSPLGVEGTAKSFATSAGGTVALINKDSKNVEAAKKYFEYRTRPEVLKKYYDQRADLNSNPSFPEVEAKPTVGLSSISKQVNNNFLADAQAGVLFYDLMPIGEEMQSMFAGVITPEQALKNIDAYRAKIGKSAGITGF